MACFEREGMYGTVPKVFDCFTATADRLALEPDISEDKVKGRERVCVREKERERDTSNMIHS